MFDINLQLMTVVVESEMWIAPPRPAAKLDVNVQAMISVVDETMRIAPP
jgi:hypothetical protein